MRMLFHRHPLHVASPDPQATLEHTKQISLVSLKGH